MTPDLNYEVDSLRAVLQGVSDGRARIQGDKSRSPEWQGGEITRIEQGAAAQAERIVTKLFGKIVANEDHSQTLDPSGGIWQRDSALSQQLTAAREKAAQPGLDTRALELRAQGLINAAHTPAELLAAYEGADAITRRGLEEFGAALMPPHKYQGHDWNRVRLTLEKQRAGRARSPEIEALEAAQNQFVSEVLPRAIELTRIAARELGKHSPYLSQVLRGVDRQQRVTTGPDGQTGLLIQWQRAAWGTISEQHGKTIRVHELPGGNQGQQRGGLGLGW
jgi:hypothetical protein